MEQFENKNRNRKNLGIFPTTLLHLKTRVAAEEYLY